MKIVIITKNGERIPFKNATMNWGVYGDRIYIQSFENTKTRQACFLVDSIVGFVEIED